MPTSPLSIADWGALFQAGGAVFTTIGVIASLYFSITALRELQRDRRHRQKPHLQFERGGYRYLVEFVKAGKRIPGINPRAVEKYFIDLPDDAESVHLKLPENALGKMEVPSVGQLKNFGLGPALSTHVTWIPTRVFVHSESFEIDKQKLLEPAYCHALNTMPTNPAHILPGEKAALTRLPTFIDKDVHRKVTRVDGILLIAAQDVFGQLHEFRQEFNVFMDYVDPRPTFHVTFGSSVPDAMEA
jgi:hypothetical protein